MNRLLLLLALALACLPLSTAAQDQSDLWPHQPSHIVISSDGDTLASNGPNNTVMLWSLSTQKIGALLEGHTNFVSQLSFSSDGSRLASLANYTAGFGKTDPRIGIWDVTSRKLLRFIEPETKIAAFAFDASGRSLIGLALNDTVYRWDVATGQQLFKVRHPQLDSAMTLTVSSKYLLIEYMRQDISRVVSLDATSGAVVRMWDKKMEKPVVSPNGLTIALRYPNNSVGIYDESGKLLRKLPGLKDRYTKEWAFSSDNRSLIVSYYEYLVLWDIQTGKPIRRFESHDSTWVSVAQPGTVVFSYSFLGGATAWDRNTGRILKTNLVPIPPGESTPPKYKYPTPV